jgi:hypothetical protein
MLNGTIFLVEGNGMGVAVYKVFRGTDSPPLLFMVESTDDDQPRRAAFQQLGLTSSCALSSEAQGKLAEVAQNVQDELETVGLVASAMLESMKRIGPSEVTLEFGVELGGKCGLPLFTEGSAKANLKVQLKWHSKGSKLETSAGSKE